jgi:rubrerythrin
MMMSIKGTQTEKNLLKAFAGESQARNRYTFFAKIAKKEGYVQIANFFTETAANEQEHAKRLFKFLEGGDVEVTDTYPAGKLGTTKENLLAAAKGEHHEQEIMYPEFAKIAKEEGFDEIAKVLTHIGIAERAHEKRFLKLAQNVENDEVFKKAERVKWKCNNCGYVHEGDKALDECPACNHPQEHFEVLAENY